MRQKSNYKKNEWRWASSNEKPTNFRYVWKYGYYRHCRTKNEITANEAVRFDDDCMEFKILPRWGRLNHYLNNWNLECLPSKSYKRSWKFSHGCRRQWMKNLK